MTAAVPAPGSAAPVMAPELESLLTLEGSFARGPYEDLRRRMRVHQRISESQFAALNAPLKDLEGAKGQQEMLDKLGVLIERVKGMKDKLSPLTGHLQSSLETLNQRTSHLTEIHEISAAFAEEAQKKSQIESADAHGDVLMVDDDEDVDEVERDLSLPALDPPAVTRYGQWSNARLNRMIIDWLLRNGHSDAAQSLAASQNIESLTDIALFREMAAIRSSLVPPPTSAGPSSEPAFKPSCAMALAWCAENKVALRRFKSTLEFDLRVQEFIDLCRAAPQNPESLTTALAYCRRHLLPVYKAASAALASKAGSEKQDAASSTAPAADGDADEDAAAERVANTKVASIVERAMGLLAVGPGGTAYRDLYSTDRYQELYASLLSAALRIYSLPPQPTLHVALSAGLASLKVPACYNGVRGPGVTGPSQGIGTSPGEAAANVAASAPPTTSTVDPSAVGEIDEELMRDVRREVRAADESLLRSSEQNRPGEGQAESGGEASKPLTDDMKNDNCPVCATVMLGSSTASAHRKVGLGVLAREVPWSHHSNSTMVCRLSGRVVDDSDNSMGNIRGDRGDEARTGAATDEEGGGGMVALPNGRVYSRKALMEETRLAMRNSDDGQGGEGEDTGEDGEEGAASSTATKSGTPRNKRRAPSEWQQGAPLESDYVICPRTRMRFHKSALRKVYIS